MKEKEGLHKLSLKQRIINKYHQLSPKEKKIADYILNNHHTVFSQSAVNLAQSAGTSSATLVRFARKLGYSGFYQLKASRINELKEEMVPEERFKLLAHDENKISTVLKIAGQEVENINQTINGIEREKIEVFIDHLRKSRSVSTVGIGVSSILARLAAYLFNQAGLRAYFCGMDEHSFIERLINLGRRDVVFGLSFPPYSSETIKSMKFCYEREVTCLSITDKLTAPLVNCSHHTLLVHTKNLMFTNSISAVTMIINALATELALLNKKRIVSQNELIYELLKDDYLT
ncbi:MAG: MurR/RpiR family transcriptional regulator [Candidatus Aminicenantes bacterium]